MKNPFGLLNIERDENDEEAETNIHKDFDPILEGPLAEHKHKRKVRPSEIKIREESRINTNLKIEDDEGFTEIRKNKRPTTPNAEIFEHNVLKEYRNKKNNKAKTPIMRGGKRMFDRHSGTGRGREVSKHGAGGKTTWGDPQQLAQEEALNYMDELALNQEERYFRTALEPEAQSEIYKSHEDKGLSGQESEFQGHVNEAFSLPEKEEPVKSFYKLESKKEQKRRKKSIEEKPEEPVFEKTENSITYAEYLDTLKKKNEVLYSKEGKPSPKDESKIGQSLEFSENNKDRKEYEEWVEFHHQKKKKPKEKKLDSTENDLNKLIGQKFVISEKTRPIFNDSYKIERESIAEKFARPTRYQNDFPEL